MCISTGVCVCMCMRVILSLEMSSSTIVFSLVSRSQTTAFLLCGGGKVGSGILVFLCSSQGDC